MPQKKSESETKRLSENIAISKGGTSIVDIEPIITPDSKWLLCGNGTKLRVYSIASGEIVNDLVGHLDVITYFIVHPQNQLQALSCALDKCIIRWDYIDAVMLQKYELGVYLYCLLPWNPGALSYFVIYEEELEDEEDNKTKITRAARIDLPKQKNDEATIIGKGGKENVVSKETKCAVGCTGEYVVCANENELRIVQWNYKTKEFSSVCHINKPQTFTCVSCHPTEHCIATGTSDGNIVLWYDFLTVGQKAITTRIHWHALPVLSLKFSAEGYYLLSGGHECVLVRWEIESLRKDFLPRLGSAITHIISSRDASLTATCQADNGIQVISNSSNKVVQIFQGLTRTSLSGRTDCLMPAGMVIDPRTSLLVMNGNSGHIQFYSIHNDKQMYNLDIVGQNYVTPQRMHKPLIRTEVENVAFSDNGMWLATIERRDDKKTTPEIRLKFWIYFKDSQNYKLNTTVESPHSGKVRALRFRATGRDGSVMAVTTCKDGKFKLWSLVDDTDIYRSNQCWNCESVGFYKEFPAGPVDFSEDGSLLAVGFASKLTLWDPDTNGFRKYLSHLASRSDLRHVLFGHGSNSHVLLTANAATIVSWNLLSCSAQWSIQFSAEILVADPRSDHFAAFEENGKLRVFNANSVTAIFEESFPDHQIIDAVFVPHQSVEETRIKWQKKSQLYFMNKEQKLLTLGKRKDEENENKKTSNVKLHQNLPETAFGRLLAEKKATGLVNQPLSRREGHQGQPGTHFIKELMGTPAHALPPVTSLCLSFMDTLTLKTKAVAVEVDEAEEEEDNAKDLVQDDASDSDEGEDENKRESKMDIDLAKKPSQIEHLPDLKPQRTYDKVQHELFSWMKNL